ncbi:MAG: phage BR0599 family protein [Rhodobacteraceae bacterium]|nr:phage BR0599 family protein [Paracoccaceae bacterium]
MSIDAMLALISGKRPFFLYEFSRGGARWFFTSLKTPWDSVPDAFDIPDAFAEPNAFARHWVPSGLKHGKIPHSTKSARSEFLITFPQSDPFVRLFLSPIGLDPTRVRIYKGFENDPDAELATIYRGRVLQANPSDKAGTIALVCGGGLGELDRKALPAVMQGPCRHVVYYGGCGLDLDAWKASAVATALTGVTLTVPDAASQADGHYAGGMIEVSGAREMIERHEGSELVLAAPVIGLAEAIAADGFANVSIARGCDRRFVTCRDAFSNEDNHGGFPHMSTSPFDGRSIY